MKIKILSLITLLAILTVSIPTFAAQAANIDIGDYVQMGTYYGKPILWRCVDIDENGPLMLSDKIICLKPFDAVTSLNDTTGSHSRRDEKTKKYSSNYWYDSNMRSWLNSKENAGNVTWLCGNPPVENTQNDNSYGEYNEYSGEAGFLTNFTDGELNTIKEVSQKSIVSHAEYDNKIYTTGVEPHKCKFSIYDVVQNYDSAYAETVTDKIFLLDVKQLYSVFKNENILGEDYYIGEPTLQCVENSEFTSKDFKSGEKWCYSLRTPYVNFVDNVRYVYSSGHVYPVNANAGYLGVRPAFYLDLKATKFTSGAGTDVNPYTVDSEKKYNTNSTSSGAPIIESVSIAYNGAEHDLFNNKVQIDQNSDIIVSVTGVVNANGCEDVHLYITQGADTAIEIPLNTCKDIKIGKEFSPGKPIYMTAIDRKTGKSTSKRTKLSVVGNSIAEGQLSSGVIKLIEDFGVDIPDDVPVLGGQKFGFGLGSISSEVEIDGNEFKVALGTDFFERQSNQNQTDRTWKDEEWNGFKNGFKDAKSKLKESAFRYHEMKSLLKKFNGTAVSVNLKNSASSNGNVTGYIEGYIDESGRHITEGGIILSAEVKYTYQGMVVVVAVPLYYEIGAGGELTFVGGVKDLIPSNGLQGAFTGSLTPALFFEVGGGVGIPVIFTAGVSGEVKAELEIALNKVYQKLDVTGTAKFKLEGPFGIPTYEKPFANGTFHIYETGNKNTLLGKTAHLYSLNDSGLYPAFDIDAPLTITPHDDSTQVWSGGKTDISLMADYTNQEVKTLEEDSYENAAPVLANMNGKNVIAWITDNKDRSDGNKPMLVYSVEDNGSWSAPVAVYDDGMADASPKMKDGYIVWQKMDGNITDGMTTREMSGKCEIYIAKWNGAGFDEPVRVTDNSVVDQVPTLAVNNGAATVVWIQNSENDFTGLIGENKIMSYTAGKTKTEATLNEAITWLDTAYINGSLNIAYETDADDNFNTLEDREIYTYTDSDTTQITNNDVADTHPTYGVFEGKSVLYYYSDGKIVYLNNGVEEPVTSSAATDQFAVVSNSDNQAVLWTAVSDGTYEIHGALYENGKWSEDVQISDIGQRVKFPSAVMQSDGSIFAAFNRTEKVSDGADYYVDGQSDLCTIKVVPSYDLALTDTYIDEDTMTVYATVTNSGELNVDSYTLTINDNGVNAEKTITEPLKAGESADVEIVYNKPETLTEHDIEVTVTTTAGDEYNTQNNTVTLSVGHADIAVDNVAVNAEENKITADISNAGYIDAENVTVRLKENNADGTVLDEQTVRAAVNETQPIEFTFDKTAMRFYDSTKQLYITAEYDGEEVSVGNNDGYAVITSPSGAADYQTEILSYDRIDGRYMINSVAVNNTNAELTCQLYTAVYSADGVLKGCGAVGAVIDANDDTGVDISVPCEIESGDIIKAFMWKNQEPLSNTAELAIE